MTDNTELRVRIVIESRVERRGIKSDWREISEYEVKRIGKYVDALAVVDRAKSTELTAKEAWAAYWMEVAKQPFSGGGWPA